MLSWPPATTISLSPAADRLIAERDRAQPRAAELVDAVGGRLERDAGADRGLARRVLAFAGGEDLAHDDLGHSPGSTFGAPHRLRDRDLAEFMRRQAGQPAVERPDRRAGGAGDDDVGHRDLLKGITPMWAAIGECKSGARRVSSRVRADPAVKSHRSPALWSPPAAINDCILLLPMAVSAANLQPKLPCSLTGRSIRASHPPAPAARSHDILPLRPFSGCVHVLHGYREPVAPSPRKRGEGDKGRELGGSSGRGELGSLGEREGLVAPAAAPLDRDQRGEAEQRGKYQVIAR